MESILAMGAALILDRLLGDPAWVPHPVVGLGRLIAALERRLARPDASPLEQLLRGGVLLAAVTAAAVTPPLLIMAWTSGWLRLVLMVLIFWLALSLETMGREARQVHDRVVHGTLMEARTQVGRIVGRDTAALSRTGVIKAAVESVAESTSDGIAAPLIYGILLGPAGAMLYKAVNTLDSMVGYREDRYLYFGRASARADDLLNLIPARITGLLAALLAFTISGSSRRALAVYWRDRTNHASPNSGHPEAAFAGALDIELAGPAAYGGVLEEKPWINCGAGIAQSGDILRSIRLMERVVVVLWSLFAVAGLLSGGKSSWM